MNVRLEEVTQDNLQIMRNLSILYRYDLMPYFYSECAACDLNEFGTFDEGKRAHDESATSWDWVVGKPGKTCAFLIWAAGALAGFAAVCMPPHCDPSVSFRMNDFFVLNKFRREGVGQQAAWMVFDRFRGWWELEYAKRNVRAAAFWRKVVSEYTSNWEDWRQEGRLAEHMEALKFDTAVRLTATADGSTASQARLPEQPQTRRELVIDHFQSTKVADPYRWLENYESAEVQHWVSTQNGRTRAYFAAIPEWDKFRQRVIEVAAKAPMLCSSWTGFVTGKYDYYRRTEGLEHLPRIYRKHRVTGEEQLVLNPTEQWPDGSRSIGWEEYSDDDQYMAYSAIIMSSAGTYHQETFVYDIERRMHLAEDLAGIARLKWMPGGKSYLHSRATGAEAQQVGHRLYCHVLGEQVGNDRVVFEQRDNEHSCSTPCVTEDGCYLLVNQDPNCTLYCAKLLRGIPRPHDFIRIGEHLAIGQFVGNSGATFFFLDTAGASRGRVLALDIDAAMQAGVKSATREVIPASAEVIDSVNVTTEALIVSTLADVQSRVRHYTLDGKPIREIPLPPMGFARVYTRPTDSFARVAFESFIEPLRLLRYDLASGVMQAETTLQLSYDPERFRTIQAFATAEDGTSIPMFITARKDAKLDGQNPTLLHGYGARGVSLIPSFWSYMIPWLEAGGVFATAGVRGGGEYGSEWQAAGEWPTRQTTIDDFGAAARRLIISGWTSPDKLAIKGMSAGGFLVGATINQDPGLFRAAIINVGALDSLRSSDGRPDDPNLQVRLKLSPLQNVRSGMSYPAVYVYTGNFDDGENRFSSMKFAATLQGLAPSAHPVLLHIEESAGHASGQPNGMTAECCANELTFLWKELDGERGRVPPAGNNQHETEPASALTGN